MTRALSHCHKTIVAACGFLSVYRGFIAIALIFSAATVSAAAINAGKPKVQQECASCHQPSDWEGETEASLSSLMKDIVRGKVNHHKKQLTLSDQDIENIAAYWVSSSNKKK